MALVLTSLYGYYNYYFNEYVGEFTISNLCVIFFALIDSAYVDCRRATRGNVFGAITLASTCHYSRLSFHCSRKRSKLDEGSKSFRSELDYQRVQHRSSHLQSLHGCRGEKINLSRQPFLNFPHSFKVTLALFETENLNMFCIPAPWGDFTKPGLKILHYSHMYYLIKIMDLLDTIFFILRKKNNQVTFLHIYHHAIMVLGGYFYIKFISGGGHAVLLGECLLHLNA